MLVLSKILYLWEWKGSKNITPEPVIHLSKQQRLLHGTCQINLSGQRVLFLWLSLFHQSFYRPVFLLIFSNLRYPCAPLFSLMKYRVCLSPEKLAFTPRLCYPSSCLLETKTWPKVLLITEHLKHRFPKRTLLIYTEDFQRKNTETWQLGHLSGGVVKVQ